MSKYFVEIDSELAYKVVAAQLEKSGYKWASGDGVRSFKPEGSFLFCLHTDDLVLTFAKLIRKQRVKDSGFKDGKHLFPLLLEDNV